MGLTQLLTLQIDESRGDQASLAITSALVKPNGFPRELLRRIAVARARKRQPTGEQPAQESLHKAFPRRIVNYPRRPRLSDRLLEETA